jgi:hypothetical protein
MSESESSVPDNAEDPLVLAMPRKELYRINGFVTTVDMAVIESVAEDQWYAAGSTLVGNLDAKEIRLGLLVTRDDQVLLDESGNLLHTTRIGPEIGKLGRGLKALRELARLAGARFLGVDNIRCELAGYLNEDSLPEHRHAFYMIYRCRLSQDVEAPSGLSWVRAKHLSGIPLDPVSILISGTLFPTD